MRSIREELQWMDLAACQEQDPILFYPKRSTPDAEALIVCAGCPVANECLEYALEEKITFGIWGGKTQNERMRLIRLTGTVSKN